ncbi:MAG: mevalonate kinase [Gammaproteobacteria bacterium CG11_big_fil_rev_8_21_14_0_20_46_22]|nr:MAG: mevalonate kinase [Gammaproteobacteria bacterium CG12_big_fil_rev_8_21_14_0_65_46_12]PIR11122.1 MAG: mevalonate kinase [Gammaproteobacteria bacterium CG11_big_fil_rev_8_21_14_0_20_46_22]
MRKSSARAPGKLIISGEHAVVYDAPAISVAVNRYVTSTVSSRRLRSVLFHLADLRHTETSTYDTLRKLKHRLKSSYQKFLDGDFHVRDVLEKPFELAQFAFVNALDHVEESLSGLNLETHSDVPTGCGLGSSAALAVSITGAVLHYHGITLGDEEFFELVKVAENMQHGYTKGLDVMTSFRGGAIHFKQGQYTSIDVPDCPITLINTGQPESTTGEAVFSVRKRFGDSGIWSEFSEVTEKFYSALCLEDHQKTLFELIAKNQTLLETIGVVPDKVRTCVADLQERGVAAKLCGAGSVSGDAGGIVLALSDDLEQIEECVKPYGYSVLRCAIDRQGLVYD